MRVAFVVQRYGNEVIGGAEAHARLVAEHLVAHKGWQVEVFTTTAGDYETWSPHYPVGKDYLAGVTIHRFPCHLRRLPWLFKAFNRLVAPFLVRRPQSLPGPYGLFSALRQRLEHLWFILQGPYCPSLISDLQARAGDFSKVFFFTYLYYPTVYGLPLLRAKAVLIPTAHPEPPLYFPRCYQALAAAAVFLLNSAAEEELLDSLRPPLLGLRLQAGVGIAAAAVNPALPSIPTNQPYLLYLGRVSKGKGLPQLLRDFCRAKEMKNPGTADLQLIIAGAHDPSLLLPHYRDVHFLGVVDEATKASLLGHAYGVVNPSPMESLSLLVLEALAAGMPVLVNNHSPVLASYARLRPTVFAYSGGEEFSAQLKAVAAAKESPSWPAQIEAAQQWVQAEYGWPKVLAAYETALHL